MLCEETIKHFKSSNKLIASDKLLKSRLLFNTIIMNEDAKRKLITSFSTDSELNHQLLMQLAVSSLHRQYLEEVNRLIRFNRMLPTIGGFSVPSMVPENFTSINKVGLDLRTMGRPLKMGAHSVELTAKRPHIGKVILSRQSIATDITDIWMRCAAWHCLTGAQQAV